MENELINNLLQFSLKLEEFKARHLNIDEAVVCRLEDNGIVMFMFTVNDTNAIHVSIDLKHPTVSIDYVYKILYQGLHKLRDTYMKPITLFFPEKEDKNFSYVPVEIQEYFVKKKDAKNNGQSR